MIKSIITKYKTLPLALKASAWFLVCNVLLKGIALITVPLFTRIMSAEQYGEVTLYLSWYSLLYYIVTLNLTGGGFSKGLIKYADDRNRFVSSMQGLTTVLVFAWVAIYIIAKKAVENALGLPTIVVVLMLLQFLLVPSRDFWLSTQRFDYKYLALVFLTVGVGIASPLLSYLAVVHTTEKGLAKIVVTCLVEIAVGAFFYIFWAAKGRQFCNKEYWKFALRFNVPLVPHYLSMQVLAQSDRIVIEKMFGTGKVAIYGVAYSISTIMSILTSALNSTFIPWTYKRCSEKKFTAISRISNILLIFMAAISIIPVLFAPEVIAIMAPPEYYEAIWIIPPVATSVFFTFLYTLFGNIEFYFEKTRFVAIASLGGAILNIVLNYLFMPHFGYIAAGYTTMACYILFAILHYVFMSKVCLENFGEQKIYNGKEILKISLLYLALVATIMATYPIELLRYAIAAFFLIFAIVERNKIQWFIKSILQKNDP